MKLSKDSILGKLNWLMENLPNGFLLNDVNDPNNSPSFSDPEIEEKYGDAGPLQRLSETYFNELDEYVIPKIEGLKYLNDPLHLDEEHCGKVDYLGLLRYIAWLWGDVRYEIFQNEEQYRGYLAYAVHIHRNRGSITAINMFLGLFGLTVKSTDHQSFRKSTSRYDIGLHYDTVTDAAYTDGLRYDYNAEYNNGCTDCAVETIHVTTIPDGWFLYAMPQSEIELFLDNLTNIIEDYLTPVNVKIEISYTLPTGLVTRLTRWIKTRQTKYITIFRKYE